MDRNNCKRPTISDIAARLNLSTATVSRALRGSPLVKAETARQVLQVAQELGYVTNHVAQALHSSTTRTIGIVVPSTIGGHVFPQIFALIQRSAMEHGYAAYICTSSDSAFTEAENLQLLMKRRVDGIIIRPVKHCEQNIPYYQQVINSGIPLVFLDCHPQGFPATVVTTDHYQGARQLVESLLNQGVRHIAFMHREAVSSVELRLQGYLDALTARGIPVDDELIAPESISEPECLERWLLDRLQRQPLDGIFCVNEGVCKRVLAILSTRGRLKDIALATFDDVSLVQHFGVPLLCGIQNAQAIANACMELVLDNPAPKKPQTHVFQTRLIQHLPFRLE
ncbi:MAG TPA: LacI family transcriptional regulator [Firmicutes bacterium]|nr:LacI family transcriptional regulator [Bacillota bacterium]